MVCACHRFIIARGEITNLTLPCTQFLIFVEGMVCGAINFSLQDVEGTTHTLPYRHVHWQLKIGPPGVISKFSYTNDINMWC